jgi:biopolymer transport protein ExbB
MGGLSVYWDGSDLIGRSVALLLLGMSVLTWVTLLWKAWLLRRVRHDVRLGQAAFWDAPELGAARERLAALDREAVLVALVAAAWVDPPAGTLQSQADPTAQLTRRLRDALQTVLARLTAGQVLLASVGAVAPFVGLFGTVWGIYHALLEIAASGGVTIEKISGPVGEALIMTAAGLAVAIPAVLAYNVFGKWLGALEADLEGFAHDLRELAWPLAAPRS